MDEKENLILLEERILGLEPIILLIADELLTKMELIVDHLD